MTTETVATEPVQPAQSAPQEAAPQTPAPEQTAPVPAQPVPEPVVAAVEQAPADPVAEVAKTAAEEAGDKALEPDPAALSAATDIDPELAEQFERDDGDYIHPASRPAPAGPEEHPRIKALREAGLI